MSAFHSSTDDRDDANKYLISGVIGQVGNDVPMNVWRLNLGAEKRKLEFADVFDLETPYTEEECAIDPAWLDKVDLTHYTYGTGVGHAFQSQGQGRIGYGMGFGWEDWELFDDDIFGKPVNSNSKNKFSRGSVGTTDLSGYANAYQRYLDNPLSKEFDKFRDKDGSVNFSKMYSHYCDYNNGNASSTNRPLSSTEHKNRSRISDFSMNGSLTREELEDLGLTTTDVDIAVNYGLETLDARDEAIELLEDVQGCDLALIQIIREAYSKLGAEGQQALAESGL